MTAANVKITGVNITPNPVQTKGAIRLSVKIEKTIFGLATASGKILTRADGRPIVTTKG
ncbi:hypothetical protein [Eubacterium sp. An11]|uniref:hypothetical protein n=1 Tax=Eubacterium sp. An11 TaxID=1965542 RepID=UPI0013A661FB|nr:hypothetical protein [Eubacterium sp. An11]